MNFTLTEAIVYDMQERRLDWAVEFLKSTDNKRFAEMISLEGIFIGPVEVNLSSMVRICGPEKEMKYPKDKDQWEEKIQSMEFAIETGWDIPPIMIWYKDQKYSIAHGNNRFEALKKSGIKKYWSLIWFKTNEDYITYLKQTQHQ